MNWNYIKSLELLLFYVDKLTQVQFQKSQCLWNLWEGLLHPHPPHPQEKHPKTSKPFPDKIILLWMPLTTCSGQIIITHRPIFSLGIVVNREQLFNSFRPRHVWGLSGLDPLSSPLSETNADAVPLLTWITPICKDSQYIQAGVHHAQWDWDFVKVENLTRGLCLFAVTTARPCACDLKVYSCFLSHISEHLGILTQTLVPSFSPCWRVKPRCFVMSTT